MHFIGSLRDELCEGSLLGFPGQTIKIHADHLVGTQEGDATVIDLIEYIVPESFVGNGPVSQMNKVGIDRMAFDVENMDEVYAELKKRDDVRFLCEPVLLTCPTGGYMKATSFVDPFGIFLEFLEHFDEKPEGWELTV